MIKKIKWFHKSYNEASSFLPTPMKPLLSMV